MKTVLKLHACCVDPSFFWAHMANGTFSQVVAQKWFLLLLLEFLTACLILLFLSLGASIEAGGFANLEFNPLRSVEGCMYKITPEELEVLDKYVGYPEVKYYSFSHFW